LNNLPTKSLTDSLAIYQAEEDVRRAKEQANRSQALAEYLKQEREFRLYGKPMEPQR
jgi:hypothetical protein